MQPISSESELNLEDEPNNLSKHKMFNENVDEDSFKPLKTQPIEKFSDESVSNAKDKNSNAIKKRVKKVPTNKFELVEKSSSPKNKVVN